MMSVVIVIWSDMTFSLNLLSRFRSIDYCPDAGINQKFRSAEYPRDA